MPGTPPTTATIESVNRGAIRVWGWGDPGDPPVWCVHGAHDHGRMWDDFAPRLAARGLHVRAIDVRGHGDSSRLASGHMWDEAVLDILALVGRDGDAAGVIGHSMGAGQVFTAVATAPELFRWAVSIDGLGPPTEAFDQGPIAELARESLERSATQLARGIRVWPTREAMVERRGAVNTRLPRPWVEHLVEHGSTPVEGGFVFKTDLRFSLGVPDGFTVEHALADFGHVTVPTLVLMGGEHDTWSDLTDAEIERRTGMLPDARLVTVPDAGHYVHLEQPDTTFAAVCTFLDEVAR